MRKYKIGDGIKEGHLCVYAITAAIIACIIGLGYTSFVAK